MRAEVHRRLLGADRGLPERRVHWKPAGSECFWAPGPRTIRSLDLEPYLAACWSARAELAESLLARFCRISVEQRGRARERRQVDVL